MDDTFDAFISYRRSDGAAAARRIRRLLQDYRPPASLQAKAPRRLRVYLDEIYERATDDFFERTILPALRGSSFLIVVATPDAVDRGPGKADWIRREVAEFEAGPNAGRLSVVLADGPWGAPLPADLGVRHPNLEVVDLRGLGPFSFLVPTRAARHANEVVKLVATLLGIGTEDMPALRREEERRQQARLGSAAGLAFAALLTLAATSAFAFASKNRAVDALSRSKFAAERLIEAAASAGLAGESRTRLLATSCDLLDSLVSRSGDEAGSASLVTCAAERAEGRDGMGERATADRIVGDTIGLVEGRFAATRQADDAFALVSILAIALGREIGATTDGARLQPALDRFIQGSRAVADALPRDAPPVRLAAETLVEVAVHLGSTRPLGPALSAAGAAVDLWDTLARRDGDASVRIEEASALGLLARLQRLAGHPEVSDASGRRGCDVLRSVVAAELGQGDRARLDQVRALLVADVPCDPASARGR